MKPRDATLILIDTECAGSCFLWHFYRQL